MAVNRYKLVFINQVTNERIYGVPQNLVQIDLYTTRFSDAKELFSDFKTYNMLTIPLSEVYKPYIIYRSNGQEKTLRVAYKDDKEIASMARCAIDTKDFGLCVDEKSATFNQLLANYLSLWRENMLFRQNIRDFTNLHVQELTESYFENNAQNSIDYLKIKRELSRYKNARGLAIGIKEYRMVKEKSESLVDYNKRIYAAYGKVEGSLPSSIANLVESAIFGGDGALQELYSSCRVEELQKLRNVLILIGKRNNMREETDEAKDKVIML